MHQIKVATYTRVSTKKQKNNTSQDSQLESINQFISQTSEFQNASITHYSDIFSASRSINVDNMDNENIIFSRTGLTKLILDAQSKKIQYLLCYSHDRLSRNVDEYFLIKHMLNKLGVKIIYTKPGEEINSENLALNNLFENLLNNLSALESNIISARVKLSGKHKILNNTWAGGPPPYGYALVPSVNNSKHTVLKVNPIEALVIKKIFHLYNSGYSTNEIADYIKLNYPANTDRKWTHNTIRDILKNPVYKGSLVWNKRCGIRNSSRNDKSKFIVSNKISSNVIIDDKTWNKSLEIRNILHQNGKYFSTNFLIQNFVFCGTCGKELQAKNYGYNKRYYYCKSLDSVKHLSFNAQIIDLEILNTIRTLSRNYLQTENNFTTFYDTYIANIKSINETLQEEITLLTKEVSDRKNLISNCSKKVHSLYQKEQLDEEAPQFKILIEALEESIISFKIFNQNTLEEIKHKNTQLLKLPNKEELKIKLLSNSSSLEHILKSSDTPTKTRALRLLLHKILFKVIIFENKSIEVIFK